MFLHRFDEICQNFPGATALICEDRRLSYGELQRYSKCVAGLLRTPQPPGDDEVVGVLMDRRESFIFSILGILRAGGAYLALDPEYPIDRLALMVKAAGCKVILTTDEYLDLCEKIGGRIINVSHLDLQQPDDGTCPRFDKENGLAYIFFTSGSSGQPKGVMVEHASLHDYCETFASYYNLTRLDVVIQQSSGSFDISVEEIFPILSKGGILNLFPSGARDAEALINEVKKNKVTVFTSTPLVLRELNKRADGVDSLRIVISGGEVLKPSYINNLVNKFKLYNTYGPTEGTVCTTYHEITDADTDLNVIGSPLNNRHVYILDEELQPVDDGIIGEICIGGRGVARGYLNGDAGNRFCRNPFVDGGRMYRTGDLGRRLSDGNICFEGRADEQVKIRGYRIEPWEISQVINGSDVVEDSVVLALRDENDRFSLTAFVKPGKAGWQDPLRSFLRKKLPAYMVPARFIEIAMVPVTTNGKIHREELMRLAEADASRSNNQIASLTPVEQQLSQIWNLALDKQTTPHIDENFFAVGGDSIKVTRLVLELKRVRGTILSIKDIFDHSTFVDFCRLVESKAQIGESLLSEPEIEIVPQALHYTLSSSQQRFWVIDQLGEGREVYNSPVYLRLTGEVDRAGIDHSFRWLIERHESLRTVFDDSEGVPYQRIISYDDLNFQVAHLDVSSEVDPEGCALLLQREDIATGFDLRQGPLLRVKLVRLSSDEWVLMINIHHIVTDGWSDQVIARDLMSIYGSYKRGTAVSLPSLRIQYKDFAYWQNKLLSEDGLLSGHRSYWQKQLGGSLPRVTIPEDHGRPSVKTYTSVNHVHSFNKDFVRRVGHYSELLGTTVFMTMVACLKVLLHRYTGETDIVIGTPVSGREHRDLEDQVGLYINTVVLRTQLSGADDFDTVSRKVKETCLSAYRHQVYPFEKLVEELSPARDLSRSPLFDILVVSHDFQLVDTSLSLEGLKVEPVITDFSVNKFDMTFYFNVQQEGAYLQIGYNTDLYSREHVERICAHYVRLMDQLITSPQREIGDHPYLSQGEEMLLASFNETNRAYERETLLQELMERQAVLRPSCAAIRFKGQTLTYGELNDRSNELAMRLLSEGLQSEEGVGLLTDRGFEMVIGMYGILKAGGHYIPIDPRYPPERQRYILENSGAKLLVTDCLCTGLAEVPVTSIAISVHTPLQAHYANPPVRVKSDSLAYIIYTSGSTGRPKGVMIEHHSVVSLVESLNADFGITASDKVLQITSMCFDLSVYDIFGMLGAGGTVVLASHEETEGMAGLCRMIEEEGITFWNSVPSSMDYMLRQHEEGGLTIDGTSLRLVFLSGDWIPVGLPDRIRKWYANARVISLGGATECTVWSNYYEVREVQEHWKSIPYGRPLANNYFYILDGRCHPVGIGVTGELYIGGVGVARGYAHDAEKTAMQFKEDPFNASLGGRMYRTGDLGRLLADGQMEFLGRRDSQIKIRGFRIELGEIEHVLESHPLVTHSVVVCRGERDDRYLVGYYTGVDQESGDELQRYLSGHLPAYMVPRYIVRIEEFPLNVNGKISVGELPVVGLQGVVEEKLGARDETEATLIKLWSGILGRTDIGIRDNFFDLGGHSLGATRLIAQVNKELNVKLTLRQIFMGPTIEEQASDIRKSEVGAYASIPVQRMEKYPASYAQRRFWILSQFSEAALAYHVSDCYQLEGALDIASLERAFERLVTRYEILRTVFRLQDGELYQEVKEEMALSAYYGYVNLAGSAVEEIEEEMLQIIGAPFDLGSGPLVRIRLMRMGENDHRLLLVLHHIIADEWSMQVLIREFGVLYAGYRRSEVAALAALPIQYKDYAVWHNSRVVGEEMEGHRRYWLEKFSRAVAPLQLPVDYARGTVKQYRGTSHEFVLDEGLTEKIDLLSRAHNTTLYVTMLTAVNALLYRYTGQRDIVIGSPVAGRNHDSLAGQVGLFLNTIALRTEIREGDSFETLLARTKETVIGAYDHQDYPFDKLLESLKLKKDTSRSPLFDVWVVLMDDIIDTEVHVSDLILRNHKLKTTTSKFDVSFFFIRSSRGLQVSIEYDRDLFEEKTIALFEYHLVGWLKIMLADPGTGIDSLKWNLNPTNLINANIEFNLS